MQQPNRVLLLIADLSAASNLRTALESRGYQVRLAYDGLAALAATRADPFDLLVIDLDSPGLNGVELLEAMAAAPALADARVMALAGPRHEITRMELFRLGVDEVVAKPVSPLEFVARVGRLNKSAAKQGAVRQGRVTVFIGAAGGVGTTTLCANVGETLGSRSETVVLDLAWPLGGLTQLLSMPDQAGVAEVTAAPSAAGALSSHLVGGPPRVAFRMLAGQYKLPTVPADPVPAADLIAEARTLASHVLIDLGTAGAPYATDVISGADNVVVITGLERTHFAPGRQWVDWLNSLGARDQKLIVVGNRSHPSPVGHRDAQRALGVDTLLIIPHNSDKLPECANEGRLLVSRFPGSAVAVTIVELAIAIDRETRPLSLDIAAGGQP